MPLRRIFKKNMKRARDRLAAQNRLMNKRFGHFNVYINASRIQCRFILRIFIEIVQSSNQIEFHFIVLRITSSRIK